MRSNPDAGSDGSMDGLNRDVTKAREITKDKEVGFDFYASKESIEELRNGHKKVAEETGFMPNFLPGMGINQSVMGQDSHETDKNLDWVYDDDTKKPNRTNVSMPLSDENPFLTFLYQAVPGAKSFSEVHDIQMKKLEVTYGVGNVPQEILAGSIVTSFMKSFVNAVGSTLDITNWGSNWTTYIKPSYKDRSIANKPKSSL